MIVYTKVTNESELDNFFVMCTSYHTHHPDNVLHCLTDIDIPDLPGVIKHDRFFDVETLGDNFCHVSPYMCFFDSIQCLLDEPRKSLYHPNMREEVREDFYMYSKLHRVVNTNQGGDDLLNMSLPPYFDWGSIIQWRRLASITPTVNTREFNPSIPQRNSSSTLIFPWERYFMAVKKAEPYLNADFVKNVVTNCKRHPYMLFYQASGAFDEWKE